MPTFFNTQNIDDDTPNSEVFHSLEFYKAFENWEKAQEGTTDSVMTTNTHEEPVISETTLEETIAQLKMENEKLQASNLHLMTMADMAVKENEQLKMQLEQEKVRRAFISLHLESQKNSAVLMRELNTKLFTENVENQAKLMLVSGSIILIAFVFWLYQSTWVVGA